MKTDPALAPFIDLATAVLSSVTGGAGGAVPAAGTSRQLVSDKLSDNGSLIGGATLNCTREATPVGGDPTEVSAMCSMTVNGQKYPFHLSENRVYAPKQ